MREQSDCFQWNRACHQTSYRREEEREIALVDGGKAIRVTGRSVGADGAASAWAARIDRPVEGNRLFVEAVLYRYRARTPWRDLPERFGDCRVVHTYAVQPLGAVQGVAEGVRASGGGCGQRICDDRLDHRAQQGRTEYQGPRYRRCLRESNRLSSHTGTSV